ncbi:hypothetical protein BDR26DRAFT_850916 [Obelidium mucronatum]|nr:hypothetical protein BDR26DRAFT_850916 [Obelidium mucronatum]
MDQGRSPSGGTAGYKQRIPACLRCHKAKKKCDFARPDCSRCRKGGHECDWTSPKLRRQRKPAHPAHPTPLNIGHAAPRLGDSSDSASGTLSPRTPSAPVSASAAFGADTTVESVEELCNPIGTTVEDLSMHSTIEDWSLMLAYVRYSAVGETLLAIIDRLYFLDTFFQQPPALRHAFCAVAALMQIPRLPSEISLSYFTRARRALSLEFHPSVKSLQALVFMTTYALLAYGDQAVGRTYFVQGIAMLLELRLHIDPDESPWLFHLNLSETDKEDRRILFWVIFYSCRMVQLNYRVPLPKLQPQGVKFAKKVSAFRRSNCSPSTPVATVCYLAMILDCLSQICDIYLQPPLSVDALLESEQIMSLDLALKVLKTTIPSNLLLEQLPGLNTWVLNLAPQIRHKFLMEHQFVYMILFEAAVVLWFAVCRTNRFWWREGSDSTGQTLCLSFENRQLYRVEVLDLVRSLRLLESMLEGKTGPNNGSPNVVRPHIIFIEAMLEEMKRQEDALISSASPSPPPHSVASHHSHDTDGSVESITIGMQILSMDS